MRRLIIASLALSVAACAAPVNPADSEKVGTPETYLPFVVLCQKNPDLPGCGNRGGAE